jgi:hypothetical protein
MSDKLDQMLKEWNDPYGARTVPDAEDLVSELQIELGGKNELINMLNSELEYFKAAHADRQKRGF